MYQLYNQYQWPIGSLVLHDFDTRKAPNMMLKVIEYPERHVARLIYLNDQRHIKANVPFDTDNGYLLDPAAFGYFVPQNYSREEIEDILLFIINWKCYLDVDNPQYEYLSGIFRAVASIKDAQVAHRDIVKFANLVLGYDTKIECTTPYEQGRYEGYSYLRDGWTEKRIIEYGKDFRW